MDINEIGVIIDKGAQDWQIFQQAQDGMANITLSGRWLTQRQFKKAYVIARIVLEDEYRAVTMALDWHRADTAASGSWSMLLGKVPRGGLYRIETALQLDDAPVEWAQRGDMVHHVGVGDIWAVAGQSNAAGYGKSPVQDPPELGLHMFRSSGEWALASHPLADSTRTRHPANREDANGSHSPFLAFARILKKRLGYPVGIIPAALGGSPISSWIKSLDGKLLDNMFDCIDEAGGKIRGICWYQGCSDASSQQRDCYLECFGEFATSVRSRYGNPALPIITAQLNRVINHQSDAPTNEAWDIIREAQRRAARELPHVHVVSTIDCGLSDCIHNSSSANLVIGERMAAMALGKVYGHDIKCLHPDLACARQAGRCSIDLIFENVDERLSFEVVDVRQVPFAVKDRDGLVPLAGINISASNTIRLELARDLQGPAVVVGLPGTNPPTAVPFDICGFRPILAFSATASNCES